MVSVGMQNLIAKVSQLTQEVISAVNSCEERQITTAIAELCTECGGEGRRNQGKLTWWTCESCQGLGITAIYFYDPVSKEYRKISTKDEKERR